MNWKLAKTQSGSIEAHSFGEDLVIRATALLPTPAYEGRIVTSPLMISPPRYVIEMRPDLHRTGGADVVIPRPVIGLFRYPGDDNVEVSDADGSHVVPVQPWRVVDWAEVGGGGEIPGRVAHSTAGDLATGFSETFSFDEAFRNAMNALRKASEPNPDIATKVVLESVTGMTGGFIGLHGMFVTVSRSHFSPAPLGDGAVSGSK